MKYLPFENITYRTKLELEEIQKRINEVIEPKKRKVVKKAYADNFLK